MAITIKLAQDECMSSGKCVANHPETFDFDDDELVVLTEGGSSASDDVKRHAARNCPSGAIRLFDDAGTELHV